MSNTGNQPVQGTKSSGKSGEPTTPVLLLRDYWDAEGNRHGKGATIDIPVSIAKQLIAARKAERSDPFPGETAR